MATLQQTLDSLLATAQAINTTVADVNTKISNFVASNPAGTAISQDQLDELTSIGTALTSASATLTSIDAAVTPASSSTPPASPTPPSDPAPGNPASDGSQSASSSN